MRRLVAALLVAFPPVAGAGNVELTAFAGPAVPFYEQTFRYDPGPLAIGVPGVTLRQEGVFRLEGRGGLAIGGAATWYFGGFAGLEARLDTADADADLTGARYEVRLEPPAPLPPLTTSVDLGSGEAQLDRLRPVSLNLKLKTPGPVRVTVSGGVSYLPALDATVTQTVGLGVTGVTAGRVTVATLGLRAEAAPEGEGASGRLGVNAGAGIQVSLFPRLSLAVEGRGFLFRKHRLAWRAASAPRNALEEELLRETLARLEPVEFNPTFFQATAGIVLVF
ncbi:MAG: hypothetical protein HY317_05930 [Acidobacteria bacterium]|nr:hypothetical protein [Acidobacteriota bacterium]